MAIRMITQILTSWEIPLVYLSFIFSFIFDADEIHF